MTYIIEKNRFRIIFDKDILKNEIKTFIVSDINGSLSEMEAGVQEVKLWGNVSEMNQAFGKDWGILNKIF